MHPISFSKGLTAAACLLCLSLFTFVEDRKSEGDSLFPVVINNRYGYINRSGKVVIPARFLDAREFQGERAWIRVGTKSRKEYGFIDTTGNLAFTKFFPDAYPFSEGIAAVAVGGPRGQRWGFVDEHGRWVIQPKYKSVDSFTDGLAAVMDDRLRWGFIDKTGLTVIPHQYIYAGRFSEGLACMFLRDRYGFIDRKGDVVIQPRFSEATEFRDGLALVRTGGPVMPHPVRPGERPGIGPLSMQPNEKQLFIDKTGNTIIELVLGQRAEHFAEGLAPVSVGYLCGYMDKHGSIAIQAVYKSCGKFSEGLASVTREKFNQVIDKNGRSIDADLSRYGSIGDFHDGLALVTEGWGPDQVDRGGREAGRAGYIDKAGKVVWQSTK